MITFPRIEDASAVLTPEFADATCVVTYQLVEICFSYLAPTLIPLLFKEFSAVKAIWLRKKVKAE